jgi:CBS domain-containing protein
MFQILDISGAQRPYVAGQIRASRRIVPTVAVEPVASTTAEHSVDAAHAAAAYQQHGMANDQGKPHELVFAHEIMTAPVIAVPVTISMREVNQLFTSRRFRHLPVLSPEGQLVGIISDRDTLKFNIHALSHQQSPDATPVSSVMVTNILTATRDTLIRDVARTMFEERIGSVPIIDENAALSGIITRSDVLRALLRYGPIRLWA